MFFQNKNDNSGVGNYRLVFVEHTLDEIIYDQEII